MAETKHSQIDYVLAAIDRSEQITEQGYCTDDDLRAIENDLLDYLLEWHTPEEADAILREWQLRFGLGAADEVG